MASPHCSGYSKPNSWAQVVLLTSQFGVMEVFASQLVLGAFPKLRGSPPREAAPSKERRAPLVPQSKPAVPAVAPMPGLRSHSCCEYCTHRRNPWFGSPGSREGASSAWFRNASWNWAAGGRSGGKHLLWFDSASQLVSSTGLMLPGGSRSCRWPPLTLILLT